MSWVALDRGVCMANDLGRPAPVDGWRREWDRIYWPILTGPGTISAASAAVPASALLWRRLRAPGIGRSNVRPSPPAPRGPRCRLPCRCRVGAGALLVRLGREWVLGFFLGIGAGSVGRPGRGERDGGGQHVAGGGRLAGGAGVWVGVEVVASAMPPVVPAVSAIAAMAFPIMIVDVACAGDPWARSSGSGAVCTVVRNAARAADSPRSSAGVAARSASASCRSQLGVLTTARDEYD
jgi:hypothetical protein